MASWGPLRNLSKPPSSRNSQSAKRSTPSTSENGSNKRMFRQLPAIVCSSRCDDDRSPTGTPIPIRPHARTTQHNDQEGQDEFDDNSEHVVLAIDKNRRNTLGCSYYIAKHGVLHIMEDIESAGEDVVQSLKQDLQPTIILLSPQNQGLLEREMSRQSSASLSENDEVPLPYKIELRPLADFKYDQALHKLATLPSLQETTGVRFLIPGEEDPSSGNIAAQEIGLTDERGRTLHISSSINLESKISIGCAGAIITYLQRMRASEYLPGDRAADNAYPILRLEMFSLKNTMLVNSDTLAALQIIQPESHPSAAKQGPGSAGVKESLSIYGLFYRFARTPQGKQRLRSILLHPRLDIHVIKDRQNSVAVFAKAQNQVLLQKMSKSLSKIKNMRRTLVMLHKGIEGGNTNIGGIKSGIWSSLLDFCFHIIDLSETLTEVIGADDLKLYRRLHHTFNRLEFQRLGKIMFDVVDLEESQYLRRTVVKRGINEDLDRVKDAYNGMDDMLQQVAIETVPELNLPPQVPEPNLIVMYLPQLGFHVLVPIRDLTELEAHGVEPRWERVFKTEESAYFKTAKTRQMDADLGDVWACMCDIEIEISHGLAQKVLEKEDFLIEASDLCGELDTILALAHGVTEYKLTRPYIVEENVIDIQGGRHLLQELTVPAYIANDTFMIGGDGADATHLDIEPAQHPNMLLLTGPNFSGKSVYLKQVALIVYMAQVGSFVPAEAARLGITDKIMTRITTRETVSKCQSSFMIDLQQVSSALKAFTPRSLLVIDEFGKGTDNCDGAGLAAGVFSYLLSLGNQAPKVLASTHFHEIFEQGLMAADSPGLGLRQMEVQLTEKNDGDCTAGNHESEVTYLYNVKPGRSTLSYGAQCAAMNGVPEDVVNRACELTDLAMAGEDLVSACSYLPEAEMRDLEEAESVSRAFFELNLSMVKGEDIGNFKAVLSDLIRQDSPCTSTSDSNGAGTGTDAGTGTEQSRSVS